MGLHFFGGSNSSYDAPTVVYCNCGSPGVATRKLPNPNPKNFEILYSEQINHYLIVKIKYPDCTNYEGVKILVYQNTSMADLIKQGSIDPHFSNNPDFHSPIARFVPTQDGMALARKLCKEIL